MNCLLPLRRAVCRVAAGSATRCRLSSTDAQPPPPPWQLRAVGLLTGSSVGLWVVQQVLQPDGVLPTTVRHTVAPFKFKWEANKLAITAEMVRKTYKPLFFDDAMSLALGEELSSSRGFHGGAVILLAPPNAGKTTRAKTVCDKLRTKQEIRGAVYIDFDQHTEEHPKDALCKRFFLSHAGRDTLTDAIPAGDTRPFVVICDNVEAAFRDAARKEAMFELLRELTKISTNGDSGRNFVVLAICHEPSAAEFLLNINHGVKVRMLAYNDLLVGGNKDYDATAGAVGSWKRRGLKWDRESSEALIDLFLQDGDLAVPLTPAQREQLVEISAVAGSPGHIRTFFRTPFNSPHDADVFLREMKAEVEKLRLNDLWLKCAEVGPAPKHPGKWEA